MIVRLVLVDLPRHPSAPAKARAQVNRFPCDLSPGDRGNAIQAVNELVTDAYLHGQGHIRLRLESTGHGLRAEVESKNGTPRETGPEGVRLDVVRSLSESSGIDDGGRMTWFEIGTNGTMPSQVRSAAS
jgi:hypothetical protein